MLIPQARVRCTMWKIARPPLLWFLRFQDLDLHVWQIIVDLRRGSRQSEYDCKANQFRREGFALRRAQSMYHNAIQPNSDADGDRDGDYTVTCPYCRRILLEQVYVGPTGELIGCEDCALERGLIGEPITLDEWFAPEGLPEVLRRFGLGDPHIRKPDPSPTQQPRAHYWEVTDGGSRYFLKR